MKNLFYKKHIFMAFLTLISISVNASENYDATVAQDGSGNYTSVQQAIDAAPDRRTEPWRILVKPGSYREMVNVPAEKTFIHLIGTDAQRTIIHHTLNVGKKPDESTKDSLYWKYSTHNPKWECYGDQGTVVLVKGDDFYAENITFQNDFGVDFFRGPQALALSTQCDRAAFYKCIFRSFQDTWMTTMNDKNRHYIKDCWIEGAVDYFYGSGEVFVENTTFYNVRHGSIIVAPAHGKDSKYGYVMYHCTVDGNDAAANVKKWGVKLGRPWHNNPRTAWIHTNIMIPIHPEGWTDMGAIPALFAEYDSRDATGKKINLSGRKTTYKGRGENPTTGTCPATITSKEASKMTYENVVKGSDGWNPRKYMEKK